MILCFVLWVPSASACTVRVAVASNFAPALRAIVQESEELANYKIDLISGSSGGLFAQIVNGAPFDLFFSADAEKPTRLTQMGRTQDAPWIYAVGTLALWTPDQSANERPVPSPIAIANPRVAPYGVAARAWLDSLPDSQRPAQQVVAESVAHAFHFARSGNARAALVSYSQLLADNAPEHEYQIVTDDSLPSITQMAVRVLRQKSCRHTLSVYEVLQSETIKMRISKLGYEVPGQTP